MIRSDLVGIIACPSCKAKVAVDGAFLVCAGCGLRYPIVDDIPVMLVKEAVRSEGDHGKDPCDTRSQS